VNDGIIDLVGYGASANCFEGTGPTAAPGNATSIQRKSNGCVDSHDNATDFVAASPNPHNTASILNRCTAAQLFWAFPVEEWIAWLRLEFKLQVVGALAIR
jgi:hypothetical protein